MSTYRLIPKEESDFLSEESYRQAYNRAYLKGQNTIFARTKSGYNYLTYRDRPVNKYDKKRGASHAKYALLSKYDDEGPGLGSPQSESVAARALLRKTIEDEKRRRKKEYELDEAFKLYQSEEEGFNSPKEAIKWCNKMHQLTNDNRYKQISNYLHIYL